MLILPSSTNCSCQCTSATSSGSQRKLGSDVGNTCERRSNTPLVDQVDVGCSERAATIYEETIIPKTETLHRITTSHVEELPTQKKSQYSQSFIMVLRHDKPRGRTCGTILEFGKEVCASAYRGGNAMHWRSPTEEPWFGNGRWVVSCLRKERFFDRIVPGQDERDGEECRVEGRRVSDQTRNQTHDDMTWCAQDTMSQCHVRHWNECM